MNYSGISNDSKRQANLVDKIAYIKARQQGFEPKAFLKEKKMVCLQEIQEITTEIADQLLLRQIEANEQIADLTDKVVSILSVDQEHADVEQSALELQELQKEKQKLQDLLPNVHHGLEVQKQHKQEAISRLEAVQKKLKTTPAFSFTHFLNQTGEKMCNHIANGVFSHVDKNYFGTIHASSNH